MRLEGWQFNKGAGGGWAWRYVDPNTGAEINLSPREFVTLLDCINDAALHGYDREAHKRIEHRGRPAPAKAG